ncbi:MAG: hypothetical protein SPH62_03515 [Candidatus Egerieousia sp.]|nr:hypothetical protein [bacterium]MDY5255463.1 hypothetical protein [Candidatus Egerieousia sp.]
MITILLCIILSLLPMITSEESHIVQGSISAPAYTNQGDQCSQGSQDGQAYQYIYRNPISFTLNSTEESSSAPTCQNLKRTSNRSSYSRPPFRFMHNGKMVDVQHHHSYTILSSQFSGTLSKNNTLQSLCVLLI